MRHDPPKPKVLRPAARHADTAETDDQDRLDICDVDHAEPAHRTAKRGGRLGQTDSEATYSVGYGRPPKHSQFKPGRSGHPKGRAPLSRNLKTIVKQVVEEPVPLRVNGKVRRVSKFEALFQTLMNRAFRGDTKAVASIINIMKHVGYGTEIAEVSPELPAGIDYDAIVKDFLIRSGREEPTGNDGSAEDLAELVSSPKKGRP